MMIKNHFYIHFNINILLRLVLLAITRSHFKLHDNLEAWCGLNDHLCNCGNQVCNLISPHIFIEV